MKSVHCWNDLEKFGVVLLTGEACGLSYRLLCDVTARGKKTLERPWGWPNLGFTKAGTVVPWKIHTLDPSCSLLKRSHL